MSSPSAHTVVVGASVAGLGVAESLRASGYEGRITVLERDSEQPCDRPPLSKGFLLGEDAGIELPYAAMAATEGVEVLLGEEVTALRPDRNLVHTATGRTLTYSDLVVATGSRPRRLPVPGRDAVDIQVLRGRRDAMCLRARAAGARSAVIVGAGVLGLEIASSLRRLGVDVEVVTNLDVPLNPAFGKELAEFERVLLAAAGVGFRSNTSVRSYHPGPAGTTRVELETGAVLTADLVVEAVGAEPCTGWLAGSGLTVDDGIHCDAGLQAAPHVYAAGDVCRWFNPRYGRSMRIEHWTNALDQAALAAQNIAGSEKQVLDGIPYFWSDHFGCHLQFAGTTTGHGVSGQRGADSLTVRYLDRTGREIGVLSVNDPRPILEHRRQPAAG
ncbi:NAD(P)/FAD-dependent oxidoreductase [Amycolatopsis rubida]|uniref:Reductase C-terminal n=1 Tax=Amycolatopsis rubida TaxID=112413 RepID=A0A1I5ZG95_9PSEU|nr:FAD-dependent oxidoreductase [Amycolatopsis rubida]SFQ55472.1 Reductase C-terminal [Amycolatopsis rubida]